MWGAEKWGGGMQRFCRAEPGGYVVLRMDVTQAGRYGLALYFTRAPDYANLEVSLDGKRIGEQFNGYDPGVVPSGQLEFGTVDLREGGHILRFRAVGKDLKSTGYFMGIDSVELRPEPAASR